MRSQSHERLWPPLLKLKFGNGWLTSYCCGNSCKKFNSSFQFQFQFQGFQFQFHFQFHQFQFQFQFQFLNWNWNWASIPIPELNWPQPWSKSTIFEPCDLAIWRMTLKNYRAPLLCYFKLCASFRSHRWFQTWVSPETPNLGQIRRFLEPCDLEIWRMTLKNNRAPLLCYLKLYASFCNHRWIQAGVTIRKRPIWVKIDDF